jgi:ribonuclease E
VAPEAANVEIPTVTSTPDSSARNEQRPERAGRGSERGERPPRTERGGRNRQELTPRLDEEIRSEVNAPVDTDATVVKSEAATTESGSRDDNAVAREKRSRDRYGRERKPRGERTERPDIASPQATLPLESESATEQDVTPRKSYFTQTSQVPAVASEPEAAKETPIEVPIPKVEAVAVVTVPETQVIEVTPTALANTTLAPSGMPKLQPFELNLDELAQIAQQSGLTWVNSDAAKVASVQSAIAAEPKPVHVPRQRPTVQPQDDRPLVLVETKRDLRGTTLPFESTESVN